MKNRRKFTARQRVQIVLEGLGTDTSVAEVRVWASEGSYCGDHRGEPGSKKNALSLEDHATLPRELWPVIVAEVEQTRSRRGWARARTLKALGVPRATYYRQRRALEENRDTVPRPVAGRRYFLLVFLDVFSRFVPYWELLRSMDGETVFLAALTALETLAEKDREGVTTQSDNGSAFVSADFARVLKANGVGHARIHPHTPEQNVFVERVLRTLGEPWYEDELASFPKAEGAMDEIVEWYNHHRLHSGIGYVTPAAMHFGEADRIHEARRAKLAAARHRRKEENLKLRQRSLALAARAGVHRQAEILEGRLAARHGGEGGYAPLPRNASRFSSVEFIPAP